MADSPEPPPLPRSWARFGLRSLLVFTLFAALACWWARGVMLREQRRRELRAEISKLGGRVRSDHPKRRPPPPWGAKLGAWLAGQAADERILDATLPKGLSDTALREFVAAFPEASVISIDAVDARPEKLALWAGRKLSYFSVTGPQPTDRDALFAIGRIRAKRMRLHLETLDDQTMRWCAEAKIDAEFLSVDMYNARLNDESLAHAAAMPSLILIVCGPNGGDAGWASFRRHPSVFDATLIGRGYTDASASVSTEMPELTGMSLHGTAHTDEGMATAISSPKLTHVWLKDVKVGPRTFETLVGLPTLAGVWLENIELTQEQCDRIAALPLTSLKLRGDVWDDAHLARFAPLAATLTTLHVIDAPRVGDEGLAWLQNAASLGALYLQGTGTTVKTWNALPNPGGIGAVGIGGPHVDAATLATTLNMPKLNWTILSGSTIDDELLAAPRKTTDSVLLSRTRVTPQGLIAQASHGHAGTMFQLQEHAAEPPPLTREQIEAIAQATAGKVRVKLRPSLLLIDE